MLSSLPRREPEHETAGETERGAPDVQSLLAELRTEPLDHDRLISEALRLSVRLLGRA